MHSQKSTRTFSLQRKQRGITFVESLVAAVIVATALVALVSTWIYSVRAAMLADARSGAYQVARTVLERARANDWRRLNAGTVVNQPTMISTPAPTNSRSNWISPSILRYRFYDGTLEELGGGNNNQEPPDPPANAEFRATTTVTASPDSTRPGNREDLRLITIGVDIHKINTDGTVQADPMTTLQTCLTQGGLL